MQFIKTQDEIQDFDIEYNPYRFLFKLDLKVVEYEFQGSKRNSKRILKNKTIFFILTDYDEVEDLLEKIKYKSAILTKLSKVSKGDCCLNFISKPCFNMDCYCKNNSNYY